MFDDIFTTAVDMPTASEIGRLAHQTGFEVWAFLKQIVLTQNEGFLNKISRSALGLEDTEIRADEHACTY